MVAVAVGVAVGVDVEPVDVRRADLAMSRRYLPAVAVAAIVGSPAGDRPHAIARAWTQLESEAKGRGLSVDELRGRPRTGVATDLEVEVGHVASLWTATRATVIRARPPLLASVA